MRHQLIAAAAAVGSLALVMSVSAGQPDEYVLPGAAVYPEGVAFDPKAQTFYVSSTTDGTIFSGTLREPTAEVFLPGGADGRTTATGLKVDGEGRLFVSGGSSGKVFVYDTATGDLLADFATAKSPTFINDVAVTRDGEAFFTDSLSPVLYRVYEDATGWHFEEWLDFTGTALVYQAGFNVNGIAATPDGRYLLLIQTNTGKVFRVDLDSQEVLQVDLGGEALTAGDGIVLRGRSLYVVRNSFGLISEVRLSGDYLSGMIIGETESELFAFPTTAAIANGRLLVVNSQFNTRMAGNPVLPFTVASVPVP